MAVNQYGIDPAMWKMLPVEDQNQIVTEWNAAHNVAYKPPAVGGYAPNAVTTPPPSPAAPPAASTTPQTSSNPSWVFAVNLPSTYPDYAAMKATGTGLVVVADDPNAAVLIQGAKQWGIPVAVQVNAPPGISPEEYAKRVAQAKAQWNPNKLVLDIESVAKGTPGTPGWEWSNQTAALLQPVVGGTSTAVTMEPNQDDYNYNAYKGLGGNTEYWVQSYLGDMTAVDPAASRQRLIANGVDPNSITVITGPSQSPPLDGRKWASWGLATSTSSAGVYGTKPGQYIPGTPSTYDLTQGGKDLANAYKALTGTPPTNPTSPTTPAPPGPPTPPAVNPGAIPILTGYLGGTADHDWAQIYFGNLGLPPDVIAKVDEIFRTSGDDPTVASVLALAYIRGTPWYAQTFPGIQAGMKLGIVADERDYRAYVNAVNQQSVNFQGRAVSGSEIASYLTNGLNVDTISRQYAGAADISVNANDYQYYSGAFGEGHLATPELTALGQQNAGISSTVGMRVQTALQKAVQRYQKVFEGTTGTPSLSLTKSGLSAPSLATHQNDIGK